VLLRAANVGGKNVFRPAQFARALKHLDIVNIGAAGTFVVRGRSTASEIEREITSQLPFACEMVVRPAREVSALVMGNPFDGIEFTRDFRGWVAAMTGKPKLKNALPRLVPAGRDWAMRIDRIDGAFAMGVWRRPAPGVVMPSDVIEKELGVRATVRWWETYEKMAKVIAPAP
jgi:uncharacterized protein (DUF1697 family)